MKAMRPVVLLLGADPSRLAPWVDALEALGCLAIASPSVEQAVSDLDGEAAVAILWQAPVGLTGWEALPALRSAFPGTRIVLLGAEGSGGGDRIPRSAMFAAVRRAVRQGGRPGAAETGSGRAGRRMA